MSVRRRDLLAVATGFAVATAATKRSFGQQATRLARIALASPTALLSEMTETSTLNNWADFLLELRRQGLIEGQNIVFERYSAFGRADKYEEVGRTIAATRPDIIFVGGATAIAQAAAAGAPDVPVVFLVGDAIAGKLVSNLARPGSNLTGVNTTAGVATEGKRIALLHEAFPQAIRIGFLDTAAAFEPLGHRPVVEAAAMALGITLVPVIADIPLDAPALARAVAELKGRGAECFCIAEATPLTNAAAASTLARRALAELLPSCSTVPLFVDAGGLMSYGPDPAIAWRRAPAYVVRILKGERPGDLPVQQPEKLDLVVNLQAAKGLGVTLPPNFLAQATEIRE